MRMGKGKFKSGPCDYCGRQANLTRDHVVPRALFKDGRLPSHPRPPIVFACNTCNNQLKSDDDALLKDLHSVDYQVWQSGQAEAQGIFETTRRAVRQGESELVQPVRDARLTWITVNGIAVPAFVAKLPQNRVERVLANIVRGLSIYYAQRRLLPDTEYVVRRWHDTRDLEGTIRLFAETDAPYRAIGDGSIFDCRFLITAVDPVLSMWILRFYGSAFYTVSTHAAGTAPHRAFTFHTTVWRASGETGSPSGTNTG